MNLLHELRARNLSDDEIPLAIQSVLMNESIKQSGPREWEVIHKGEALGGYGTNKDGKLKFVNLPPQECAAVMTAVDADNSAAVYSTVAVTLFSYRPLKGFKQVPGWIQMRPVGNAKEERGIDPGLLGHIPGSPPQPFALEIRFRGSSMWLVHAHRQQRETLQAIWLVTTFLESMVFLPRSPYAYVLIDGKIVVARCAAPQAPPPADGKAFSDTSGLRELETVPHDKYFSELGINAQEIRVPDLQALWDSFCALNDTNRNRFLRACASLAAAANPDVERGQFVVSSVTAIEALLETHETCPTCKSKVGIGKAFREFLETHVQRAEPLLKAYHELYGDRSVLTHGSHHYDVDEPTFGIRDTSFVTRLVAWSASKRGLVNWLLKSR